MTMGSPQYRQEEVGGRLDLPSGSRTATLIDVGNPQCVLFVNSFDFDWHSLGRQIETHPRFPNRTNVSFVNVIDEHTIDVRFWERGAGATLSSGTGSTGAAVAAVLGGVVKSPIRVVTQAGDLRLRWEDEVILEGPAQLVAKGEFYWRRG
jgi:diaminopimelate epimerase